MFSLKHTKNLIKKFSLEKFLSGYSGGEGNNGGGRATGTVTSIPKINFSIIENSVKLNPNPIKINSLSSSHRCNFLIKKLKPISNGTTGSGMKNFFSDGKQTPPSPPPPPTRFINSNGSKGNENPPISTVKTNANNNRSLRPGCTKSKNYYGILGIGRYSTIKEIKAAYYRLAKIYHPDATNKYNYDTNKKFQEISEAYEILSDDIRRYDYDRFGIVKKQKTEEYMVDDTRKTHQNSQNLKIKDYNEILSNHPTNDIKNYKFKSNISPEEMYKRIFGANSTNKINIPEIESTEKFLIPEEIIIPVTFLQAVRGVTKDISIAAKTVCKTCNNEGREIDYRPSPCKYCKGTGLQSISTGRYLMRAKCNFCKGTRYAVTNPCAVCGGRGKIVERKRVTINIPIGVEDGDKISVQHPTENRQISIKFNVDSSDYFERDNYDIHSKAEILLTQALLGGIVTIKGIYGDLTMKIPSGTTSHSKIRLTGKGLKKTKSTSLYGDHVVTVIVKMPTTLSTRQRALITAFAEIEGQINDTDKREKTEQIKNELNKLHTTNCEKTKDPSFKWAN